MRMTRAGLKKFCWSAQDRVRANAPTMAPRITPVFPTSVFFHVKVKTGSLAYGVEAHETPVPACPDWRVLGDQDGAGWAE